MLMWPNPLKMTDFRLVKIQQAEDIRNAREKFKILKKETEEIEKQKSQQALKRYWNLEEEYLAELRKRNRSKQGNSAYNPLLKSKSSELCVNKHNSFVAHLPRNEKEQSADRNLSYQKTPLITIRPKTPKITRNAGIQYEQPKNYLKQKATSTNSQTDAETTPTEIKNHSKTDVKTQQIPPNNVKSNAKTSDDSSTANETDHSNFTTNNSKKKIRMPPPVILKQVSREVMFVHMIESNQISRTNIRVNKYKESSLERSNLSNQNISFSQSDSDQSLSKHPQLSYRDSPEKYYHMFRDIEFDK